MAHVPHVYVPQPWTGERLTIGDVTRHHLVRVLRRTADSPVSYTDGQGAVGEGIFDGSSIVRGDESVVAPHAVRVVIAVAPPANQDRARFVVEKLAELGIDSLQWLSTNFAQGRPPREDKAQSWAVAALQQSRGGWLMETHAPVRLEDLDDEVAWLLADVAGGQVDPVVGASSIGLVIGPEGGLAPEEVERFERHLRLGSTVLRTETAAVVGAVRCLQLAGRL